MAWFAGLMVVLLIASLVVLAIPPSILPELRQVAIAENTEYYTGRTWAPCAMDKSFLLKDISLLSAVALLKKTHPADEGWTWTNPAPALFYVQKPGCGIEIIVLNPDSRPELVQVREYVQLNALQNQWIKWTARR